MRTVFLALALLLGCAPSIPSSSQHARAVAPAAPPDQAPDASGWGVAGGLKYREIVRGGADPKQPLPLLVVFHGMEGSPNIAYLDKLDVEQGVQVRIVRPQAPIPVGKHGFSWYDGRLNDERSEEEKAAGMAETLARVVRMLDVLREQRPTRGQTVVTGFSQGGMLSYALAVRHPERVGFSMPVSGYLPQPLWPDHPSSQPPRVHALHGLIDTIVPEAKAETLVAYMRSHGWPVEFTTFPNIDHRISPEMTALAHQALSQAIAEVAP
ncbi:MAG: alpha/beta hydrolase-fold protein [Polyangiales bacterium]